MPAFILHHLLLLLGTLSLLTTANSPLEEVKAHIRRVGQRILCAVPQPRVVVVDSLEQRADPPATILHRCGANTGCCFSLTEDCVAKRKEKVPLYFSVGPHQVGGASEQVVTVKWMTNHTECHCAQRSHRREKRMERMVIRRQERRRRRAMRRKDGKGV